MDNEEIKERIVEILDRTFKVIDACYQHNNEATAKANSSFAGTRLIFPELRNKKSRISEQELRFAFIDQFIRYCQNPATSWEAFYSVETPTEGQYLFKNGKPKRDDKNGRSANIDVCIHDKTGNRVCLIEFKALNPKQNDYLKDFVKLNEENVSPAFFVQLLKAQDSGTIKNILEKIESSIISVNYVCHTINPKCRKTEYISKTIKKDGWIKLK